MTRVLTPVLLLALVAGLAGCYVVSPYYPAYGPPPAPAPMPPPAAGGPPPRPAPAPAPAPGQGAGRNCQTVTVEGHSETRVLPNGQRETVFVPTYTQQVCQ
jgi:hypothetical protein